MDLPAWSMVVNGINKIPVISTLFSGRLSGLNTSVDSASQSVTANGSGLSAVSTSANTIGSIVQSAKSDTANKVKQLEKSVAANSAGATVLRVSGGGKLHLACMVGGANTSPHKRYLSITLDGFTFYLDASEKSSSDNVSGIFLSEDQYAGYNRAGSTFPGEGITFPWLTSDANQKKYMTKAAFVVRNGKYFDGTTDSSTNLTDGKNEPNIPSECTTLATSRSYIMSPLPLKFDERLIIKAWEGRASATKVYVKYELD